MHFSYTRQIYRLLVPFYDQISVVCLGVAQVVYIELTLGKASPKLGCDGSFNSDIVSRIEVLFECTVRVLHARDW